MREIKKDLRLRRAKHRVFGAVFLAGVAAAPAAAVLACGYHDDATMARAALALAYPQALHVIGAMTSAVSERRLPVSVSGDRRQGPWAYMEAAGNVRRFGELLQAGSRADALPGIALVLVEPMLWTRFVADSGVMRTEVHASGPHDGDMVLVSGEVVIGEIAAGRLSMSDAHAQGLIRLYGTDAQRAVMVEWFDKVHVGQVDR